MSAAPAFDAKSTQSNLRSFRLTTVELGSLRWRVVPKVELSSIVHVLERPDDFLTDRSLLFKDNAQVTIGRVLPRPLGCPGVVLRRLNYGIVRHQLRDLFRPSRAYRAMRHSLALEQAGIPTPRALAVAEVRRFRWPIRAYLVTEEISPVTRLRRYLADQRHVSGQVVARLGRLFARLHDSGFIHGDTKSTNILLDGELRPWLIDLDGVRQFRRTPDLAAVRDLARLAWEVRQNPRLLKWSGLRFIATYCQGRNREIVKREWVAQVMEAVKEFG